MVLHTALLAVFIALAASLQAAHTNGALEVVKLSVDGRYDPLLDLGHSRPTLAWRIEQHGDCTEQTCPGDYQTAFQVQAAATVEDLNAGRLSWDSGKQSSSAQQVRFDGADAASRETVVWRVQVWDANGNPSAWSKPSTWSYGLLDQADWGEARWIDYPDRTEDQPLPLFARQFQLAPEKSVSKAHLYLAGIGLHHVTINGEAITQEVLAPGYSNWQLSSEYRTYAIEKWLRPGANAIGVSLGNGPAYVRTNIRNPAVGRNSPYAWWQSQYKGNGTLAAEVQAGATTVALSNVTGYHLGGSINIDTGAGGDNLESRVITTIDNSTNTISFTPGLALAHGAGVKVTGSGNNIASIDPSAGAAVTPRVIGRLEITYGDGSSTVIVTDRSWSTTLGPLVLDNWYSGPDYNASREIPGWDRPDAELDSSAWVSAGIAPPPNLATKLVSRAAEPVTIHEQFTPIEITNPLPRVWVFNFGQNFAGWPVLKLPELPAGVIIKVAPSESLYANGTIDQASLGPGSRGRDLFFTYTTAGRAGGETWHPQFSYFGMQWVQVTGLPESVIPTTDLITGIRLQGNVPQSGTFSSSNERINRIHTMSRYSFMSNILSVFTDCPGREKLSYPADYTMVMGALYRNFNFGAFMRTTMHTLVEGQSVADTYMRGNVALKTPVYDWGYTRRFGDEINWGNAIVLVPSLIYDLYGDSSVLEANYDKMVDFVDYIEREKSRDNVVLAELADWVAADERTSGNITGTWGYFLTVRAMARAANLTGHAEDFARYTALAVDIHDTFNTAFYNEECACYTSTGNNSTANATQAVQALALDAGLVPEEHTQGVVQALVNLTTNFNSSGVRLSGGTIGLSSIIRVLTVNGYDDLIWQAFQQNDYPSYGYFLESTPANPNGFTTIGEEWDRSASKNHMILAQIEEWFHSSIAGIQPLAFSTFSVLWKDGLVFAPRVVGDLTHAAASYETVWGEARSEWNLTADGTFNLAITVPPNVLAEVRVPGTDQVEASARAVRTGAGDGYISFNAPSGSHMFSSTLRV